MAKKHEPVLFWDWTGSEDNPISPHDSTKRYIVQTQAVKAFVTQLVESDSAEEDAAAAGAAEEEGGGVLTYAFAGRTCKPLGDLNLNNFAQKTARLIPGGRTYIMPAIAQWEADRDEEFSKDEQADINREYNLLVSTDGALDDEQEFLGWISRSDPNTKVFFLLHGQGDDNAGAIQDYERVARSSGGKVTVYNLQGVTDPVQMAKQMVQAISD